MPAGSRTSGGVVVSLDGSSRVPLHRQLYEELRSAIVSRRFRAGGSLPSTRAMASDLKVSRNTVNNAFDQLLAEGYLETRRGAGTYVTGSLPDEMLWLERRDQKRRRPTPAKPLANRGRTMATFRPFFPPVKPRPFRHGLPALDEFPAKLWARLAARRWRQMPPDLLGYGASSGYQPLREAVAEYLRSARAVCCEWQQVVIVGGSQQALYLMAQMLLDPGDAVWLEDPGYLGARAALLAAKAQIVPVPVDRQGLSVQHGIAASPKARLIYVTPSNQYPTTVTMSPGRRLELLHWAARSGAWIIEDDYDSEFRFGSRPIASLQGLDKYNRVIYLGTFSKLLAPALRLGYLVLPRELVDAFSAASASLNRALPTVEQAVLAEFIAEGHLARHVRRMRLIYQERQQEILDAARRELGGALEIEPPPAGTHAIAWLKKGLSDRTLANEAAKQGVESRAFSQYCLGRPKRNGLVLGYGAFGKAEIRAGMCKLAAAFENCARAKK